MATPVNYHTGPPRSPTVDFLPAISALFLSLLSALFGQGRSTQHLLLLGTEAAQSSQRVLGSDCGGGAR